MNIPIKEFKAALAALNKVLPKDEKIKTLKVKKEDVIEKFTDVIVARIADGTADELPEKAIDLYNDYIVGEEEDEEEKTETTGKKSTKKTTGKKSTGTKHFVPNKSGRPKFVVEALMKGGTMDAVIANADKAYVKSGGSANEKQTKRLFENAVRYLFYAGVLNISDKGVYSMNE